MMKRLLALLLLGAALHNTVYAQSINKPRLDSLLNILSSNNKTMGSLSISQNGKTIYQKAVGYSFIDSLSSQPATVQTKYRIGSISKMFTGVITFQLIEEGKLTLETTLDKFYPQMPNAANITIGQLLSHHSGLFNITNDPAFATYMTKPQTREQMLTKMAAFAPRFEPGAKFEYSNTNFIVLAYIVEKITNQPFADVVKQRVINKAGLKDTYYGGKINTANNEALSYNFADKWKIIPETDMSIPSGAGAMVSTPADLTKFAEALFNGKLISDASLAKMKPLSDYYGMAMRKIDFDGKVSYGHNGAIDGFRAELAYFPQQKLAIAYTSNGGIYSTEKILKATVSIVFNEPFTMPLYKKPDLKTEELDKYLGVYSSPDFPLKITMSKDNTTLYGQAAGQGLIRLEATGKDRFEFEPNDIVVEFDTAKGQFILKQNGGIKVFTREK
ncbi:beta-lactamase family protein [Inquilinus sp. KBS0705]|nr:beta-lactamase family protein [Inquilinus sp. KBS0705]